MYSSFPLTTNKQQVFHCLPGLSLSLSLKTQNSILNSQKGVQGLVPARTYLVAEGGERARGRVKKETTSTRSRGWAEGGFDHPPSGSSGPRHGAGTEGRHRATSPLDEVMPSRWRRISAQQQKTWKSWRKCCVASAGLPATAREKKKTRFAAGEHLEVRGDPRRARLVASGGGERSRLRGGQGRYAGGFGLPSSPPRRDPEPTAQA